MKKEGAKRVEITAVDDERQITAVFAGGGGGGGDSSTRVQHLGAFQVFHFHKIGM